MRLFAKRKYKSGSKFAFWRWTDVPSGYIVRLHLLMTPWGALMMHWLVSPDPEPYLHDHPVSFLSIILRGRYREMRKDGWHTRTWFNFVRATDAHSITWVRPNTVTFVFVGPKVREWGFHTPEGWVYWKDYNKKKYGDQK